MFEVMPQTRRICQPEKEYAFAETKLSEFVRICQNIPADNYAGETRTPREQGSREPGITRLESFQERSVRTMTVVGLTVRRVEKE